MCAHVYAWVGDIGDGAMRRQAVSLKRARCRQEQGDGLVSHLFFRVEMKDEGCGKCGLMMVER
jgi:hypothetical protein